MIARVWNGWTTPANADAYEALLRDEVFPSIVARRIPGFLRVEMLRREEGAEIGFVTVMWFDSQSSVTAFVGPDHGRAYVVEAARRLLSRFNERSAHYEVRLSREAEA